MDVLNIIRKLFTCFIYPLVYRDNRENRAPTIPTTPTNKKLTSDPAVFIRESTNTEEVNPATSVPILEDDVDQTDVFPVSWKESSDAEVDLQDIPEVGAVVAKPEDIEQLEVHPIPWQNAKKGDLSWGGEDIEPTDLKVEHKNKHKKLPLPWENGRKSSPVSSDESITNSSNKAIAEPSNQSITGSSDNATAEPSNQSITGHSIKANTEYSNKSNTEYSNKSTTGLSNEH